MDFPLKWTLNESQRVQKNDEKETIQICLEIEMLICSIYNEQQRITSNNLIHVVSAEIRSR